MRRLWTAAMVAWVGLTTQAFAEPLQLHIERDDVDLTRRTVAFSLNAAATSARVVVFSADGQRLYEGERHYPAPAAGTRLVAGWPDLGPRADNFRLQLRVTDDTGRWIDFEIVRFYMEIPHRDVNFATGRWDIAEAEEAKLAEPLALLQEALSKYAKWLDVGLYVAGHTDTVGSAAKNQVLSDKRARAIARYFVDHGCTGIPVFVRGLGEGALLVETGDNVAQADNRRAQYILSSFAPALAGPGRWQRLQ